MENIKGAIQTVLKDLRDKKQGAGPDTLQELVKNIFSAKESAHLSPRAVKQDTLYLAVDSSTWLFYFNLNKRGLLEKAAQARIKDLKFSIGATGSGARQKKKSCK